MWMASIYDVKEEQCHDRELVVHKVNETDIFFPKRSAVVEREDVWTMVADILHHGCRAVGEEKAPCCVE